VIVFISPPLYIPIQTLLHLNNQQNRIIPHTTPLIRPIQTLICLIFKHPPKARRPRGSESNLPYPTTSLLPPSPPFTNGPNSLSCSPCFGLGTSRIHPYISGTEGTSLRKLRRLHIITGLGYSAAVWFFHWTN
jgi:hypothetical protein